MTTTTSKKFTILLGWFLLGVLSSAQAMPDLYKVVYRKGDVSMTRSGESRKIFKGDFLIGKDLIKTGPSSMVIVGFGQGYQSRMKIGPGTELALEGKVADPDDNHEEKTSFFIKLGNILVDYVNKDKDKNKLKVRTRTAAMAVRGTEFFIHTTADGQTLVAVKSGVVLAKHNDKVSGIPLTSEEGVVFTSDGGSGKLNPPEWYKEINWQVDSLNKELKDLLHKDGIDKVILNDVVSRVITVKADSVDKLALEGEPKKWQKECEEGKGEQCTLLALYLLRNGKIQETKTLVQALFDRACKNGAQRGCVWLGRVEFEFGDKDKGKGHIKKLCEEKDAYACYSMWELEKAYGSGDLAEGYRKQAVSIMHNLPDFDKTFSMFEEACLTEDKDACLNMGILSEQLNKKEKARELYTKACNLGSGAGCSNLGYIFQEDGKLKEANKNYMKACFLYEAVGCYNLACLYSKDKKVELSKQYLKMAVMGGFTDWQHIEGDSDLAYLRSQSDYQEFSKTLKESAEPQVKKKDKDQSEKKESSPESSKS
jgi:TPR repeat protein